MRSHVQSRRHNTVLIDSIIIHHLDWHGGGVRSWTTGLLHRCRKAAGSSERLCAASQTIQGSKDTWDVYTAGAQHTGALFIIKQKVNPRKRPRWVRDPLMSKRILWATLRNSPRPVAEAGTSNLSLIPASEHMLCYP